MCILNEFKIIRDHWYFRMIKRTKPWAIHTEAIDNEHVWKGVQNYVKSGRKDIWFVVTPINFDFVHTQSSITTTKKKWEKLMIERYKWLKDNGQEVQIHVHLKIKMDLYKNDRVRKKDINDKITKAVKWMRNNGFDTDKIAFGWWSYNDYAIEVAKKLGLETVERLDNYFIHDFDLISYQ